MRGATSGSALRAGNAWHARTVRGEKELPYNWSWLMAREFSRYAQRRGLALKFHLASIVIE
jgi:hypothetical protein